MPKEMRQVMMGHSPEREWFVALGIVTGLDSVFDDLSEVYAHITDMPEELRPVMHRIINTLEGMHEQIFDEDLMPDGVTFIDGEMETDGSAA